MSSFFWIGSAAKSCRVNTTHMARIRKCPWTMCRTARANTIGHYRLQLNIYRWVLEKYYDIKVVRMMVVCIHPSYLPQGFVDEVPDMQEAVEQLMDVRRQLLLSKALEEKAEVEVSEPEPTLPFPVHLSPPATADPLEDDFASALGALLEQAEDDVPQHAKKRRLLPGADVHFEKFSKMFQDSDQCISSVLNVYPADVKNSSSEILKKTKESLTQLLQAFPNTSEELRRIITVAAYVSERNLSDKRCWPMPRPYSGWWKGRGM